MSTYDFICDNCGQIEISHSIHDEHPETCPYCEAPIERTIISMVPVKFLHGRNTIDDWGPKLERQQPTSPEAGVPYD